MILDVYSGVQSYPSIVASVWMFQFLAVSLIRILFTSFFILIQRVVLRYCILANREALFPRMDETSNADNSFDSAARNCRTEGTALQWFECS